MNRNHSIPLAKLINEFNLEPVYLPSEAEKIMVATPELSRPGFAFAGFYDLFDSNRIQIIGRAEHAYLCKLSESERISVYDTFVSKKPCAVIVTSELEVFPEFISCAEKYGVPLLVTKARTSHIMAGMITWLNTQLAPRTTKHGVFVEVYGEGVLLLGDSGIGKSETAIELVKRGHRLIADDAVEIKRVSDKKLIGMAPDLIKHYVELRGIGIVDVRRIFGMGAVKEVEQIDFVINLEKWEEGKMYDRFGLQSESVDILGVNVTSTTIPVTPGRNMAIIIEIAAMNNKQKKMGYNTAEEFNKRLMAQLGDQSE